MFSKYIETSFKSSTPLLLVADLELLCTKPATSNMGQREYQICIIFRVMTYEQQLHEATVLALHVGRQVIQLYLLGYCKTN
jgi:hypothetical protein